MRFEYTINGNDWYALNMTPVNGGTAVDNTVAPGAWRADVSGLNKVRCRLTGTVLGAVSVVGIGVAVSGA